MSRNHADLVSESLQRLPPIFQALMRETPEDLDGMSKILAQEPFSRLMLVNYKGKLISPLVLAISNNKYKSALLLLDDGADPNMGCIGQHGFTALMMAAAQGHFELVVRLVEASADLNAQNAQQFTALHLAILNCHTEIFRYLLLSGSNPSIRTFENKTALDLICTLKDDPNYAERQYELFLMETILLSANKESLTAQLTTGPGIFDLMNDSLFAPGEDPDLFNFYLDLQPLAVEAKDQSDGSLLVKAIAEEKYDSVDILLNRGADPNHGLYGENRQTALILAVLKNKLDLVIALIKKGANLNAQDAQGNTALHLAAQYGYDGILAYLLIKNANHAIVNQEGYAPLSVAMSYGRYNYAQALVEKGANPNLGLYYPDFSFTNLMLAVYQKQASLVKALLEKGADLTAKDARGRSIQKIAQDCAPGEIETMILEEMTRRNSQINRSKPVRFFQYDPGSSSFNNNNKKTRFSLPDNSQALPDLESVEQKNLMLLTCAKNGLVELPKKYLKEGAQVNAVDDSGNTALHLAAEGGHDELVRFLLENGADPTIKNKQGYVARSFAVLRQQTFSVGTPEYARYSRTITALLDPVSAHNNNNNAAPKQKPVVGPEYQHSKDLRCHARFGHVKECQMALDQGAEINSRSHDGKNTALHIAARHGAVGVVELLLKRGADPTLKNYQYEQERTALDLAIQERNRRPLAGKEYLQYQSIIEKLSNFGSGPSQERKPSVIFGNK